MIEALNMLEKSYGELVHIEANENVTYEFILNVSRPRVAKGEG